VARRSRPARDERARRDPRLIHALLVAGAVATVLAAIVLPVNVSAIPRLSRAVRGVASVSVPRVSIVIPARDEEEEIERAVRSHLRQDYPDFQVVVVDDHSTDQTPAILASLGREDARLVVVSGGEPPAAWLGKPHALWEGAQAADGEILLFADADVRYDDPRTLREGVAVLEARGFDLVAFFPRLEMRGFWENVLLPYLSVGVFLGFGFVAVRKRFRKIALGAGVGNLVRRRAYEAVGGHAALKDSVIDDVHLAIAVKSGGFRVGVFRADDRIVVRIYRGFRGVWNGFTKNVAWAFPGLGGVVLFVLLLAVFAASIAPAATLLAAAAGARIASSDVLLAAAVFAGTVTLRAVLAAALRDPIWPAPTHPIMAAVWAGLLGRSLFHRFIRKRLTWRGREYDARRARF
jgi:chlorobactene glucosyltransferase